MSEDEGARAAQDDTVYFALSQDASGYPPWAEEGIPAAPLGHELFELQGSPVFVYGLSLHDVVHAQHSDGRWWIDDIAEASGHSTVRVIGFTDEAHDEVLSLEGRFGCGVSHTPIQSFFVIDIPPDVDYAPIFEALTAGRTAGLWDIDEGCITAPHLDSTETDAGSPDAVP